MVQFRERIDANVEASTYKANSIFAQELEDELMKFTAAEDCKVDQHLVVQTEVSRIADVDVNIMECTKSGRTELVEAECPDETENSSSFDGCDSGVENVDSLDDVEVLSDFHPNAALAMDFDGFGEIFRMRKKRLTTHWRSFIQPLMWRCKWVELQMKKCEEQAQKYDKKLEECSQQKRVQLEKSTVEDVGAKSLPISRNDARNDILRRKKRRKTEGTLNLAEYMSNHNLFSYYENKKHFADGGLTGDELKNRAKSFPKVNTDDELWGNEETLSHGTEDTDNSLEPIMWKIECLCSRVGKLKSRVDKVTIENAGKFSSIDDLNLALSSDAMTDSPQNTAASSKTGDRMPVGTYIASQLISEYKMGDAMVSEIMIRGGVSDVNGNTNQIYSSDAYENGEDGVLIDNRRAKEEMNNFEEVTLRPIQQSLVLEDSGSGRTTTQVPAGQQDCGLDGTTPVPAEADPPTNDRPPTKIRSISRLTAPAPKRSAPKRRKRGRRRRAGR